MSNKGIDRRVSRTRSQLQRALLSLICEKSYESITVDEICEAADVGRSTFYAHYSSKNELKRSGIDDHLRGLLLKHQQEARGHSDRQVGRRFHFSLAMFEHARDHKELYRALAGNRGGAIALGTIRGILSELVRDELPPGAKGGAPNQREFLVRFVVGGYMAVLTWWLDGGAKEAPEDLDRMFRQLASHGIEGHLVGETGTSSPTF